LLSFGLIQGHKSDLAAGMSTRNIGAALAPISAIAQVDQRAMIMVTLGVTMPMVAWLLAARWFARHASIGEGGAVQTPV
jgi:bile acid:Na+ symporter, BASS family